MQKGSMMVRLIERRELEHIPMSEKRWYSNIGELEHILMDAKR